MHTAPNGGAQRAILPEPPDNLKQLSRALSERLAERISERGPIPFREWMEAVLYEPGLGYYSAGLQKLGAEGDFVTAPELGGLFGRCVGDQVAEIGRTLDGPWRVLEIGAGSGRLAAQLLDRLASEPGFSGLDILERSADLREVQRELFEQNRPGVVRSVRWLDTPPEESWDGVIVANEVVDALAVDRFRIGSDGIEEAVVTNQGDGFAWATRPAPGPLKAAVERINTELPAPLAEGYVSEVCLQLDGWLNAICRSLHRGAVLLVDYGYPRGEYYLPDRNDGTLVCHYRHRAHGDPFWWPGLQDISAFVDFTAVAEAADRAGLDVLGYTSQALFLLGTGALQDMTAEGHEPDRALAEEARELLLPGNMGERFGVMALGRNLPAEMDGNLSGFSIRDLRHRL